MVNIELTMAAAQKPPERVSRFSPTCIEAGTKNYDLRSAGLRSRALNYDLRSAGLRSRALRMRIQGKRAHGLGLFRATTGRSKPLSISTMQAAIAAARVWNFISPTTVGLAFIFGQIFQCHQEGGFSSTSKSMPRCFTRGSLTSWALPKPQSPHFR
jgi:hypothetical protein